MAKAKKPTQDHPLEHNWVCEGCGAVHIGLNPPDMCHCEHEMFENLADIVRELDQADQH